MPAFSHIDAHGFTVTTCPDCSGPSHPSNGWAMTPTYVLCGACARAFARWVHTWTNAKGKRGRGHVAAASFYEAAAKKR